MLGLLATAGALLATQVLADTQPLVAKGNKFFAGDEQFFIKGIAYQLTNDDPLADSTQCVLDIDLMKTIGTNAIRVYHVDPTANHDTCMNALSDAGIYAFIDLDTFSTYILQDNPVWNQTQYSAYCEVMDAFHNYYNVGGFFVGNEVLTMGAGSIAAPYVKAAARDLKAYRDKQGYREIPVGYSAADIADLRPNLQNYMACSQDSADNLDFFSLNAYEWCGDNTYEGSGYSALQANASDYPIPIFFSETGCNTGEGPRTFQDQTAILGPEMDSTWSGAIIYEWIEETNDYGLISYGPPAAATATDSGIVAGYTRTGTPTPIQPEFDNLSSVWATVSPSKANINNYSPSLTPPACPDYTSGLWEVSGSDLPTLGQGADYHAPTSSRSSGSAPTSTGGRSSATGSSASRGSTTGGSSSSSTASQTSASGSASATAASGAMSLSHSAWSALYVLVASGVLAVVLV